MLFLRHRNTTLDISRYLFYLFSAIKKLLAPKQEADVNQSSAVCVDLLRWNFQYFFLIFLTVKFVRIKISEQLCRALCWRLSRIKATCVVLVQLCKRVGAILSAAAPKSLVCVSLMKTDWLWLVLGDIVRLVAASERSFVVCGIACKMIPSSIKIRVRHTCISTNLDR